MGLHAWLQAALEAIQEAMNQDIMVQRSPVARAGLADLLASLRTQRPVWLQQLARSVEEAIDEELDESSVATNQGQTPEHALTLLEEDSIDEDIALSRLVQMAELEAEGALRELAARCSRLRGWNLVQPDAHPMRPVVVARGLRRGVAALGLAAPSRLTLLRHLAPAVGSELAPLYAHQLALLEQWSVEPERFRLRLTPSPLQVGAIPTRIGGADRAPGEGPLSTAVITAPSAAGAARRLTEDALRRLALGGVATPSGAFDPAQTMARLLAMLIGRVGSSRAAHRALQRLDAPAQRLARTEPEVWRSADHPLWLLLDRLLQWGALLDEIDLDESTPSGITLDAALTRLEQDDPPDAHQLQVALQAVEGASRTRLQAQAQRLAPQAERMQEHLAREEIEARVREQVVQQMRGRGAPAALHQFLVGPWTTALAVSAEKHGLDSAQFATQAELVDTLVRACTRPRNQPLQSAIYTRCLTHARLALAEAGVPAPRIEAELADLGRTLRRPWTDARHAMPRCDDAGPGPGDSAGPAEAPDDVSTDGSTSAPATEAPAAGDPLELHDALATVPIDLGSGPEETARREAACEAWVGSLEPGTLCRLFVHGHWNTLQLVWRSLDRAMFVLSSRQADISHTLTRSTLHKLRAAGLAASIERGQFIAHALDDLAQAGV